MPVRVRHPRSGGRGFGPSCGAPIVPVAAVFPCTTVLAIGQDSTVRVCVAFKGSTRNRHAHCEEPRESRAVGRVNEPCPDLRPFAGASHRSGRHRQRGGRAQTCVAVIVRTVGFANGFVLTAGCNRNHSVSKPRRNSFQTASFRHVHFRSRSVRLGSGRRRGLSTPPRQLSIVGANAGHAGAHCPGTSSASGDGPSSTTIAAGSAPDRFARSARVVFVR